jgi:methyltransferase-like protein 6
MARVRKGLRKGKRSYDIWFSSPIPMPETPQPDVMALSVSYHSCDFDYNEHIKTITAVHAPSSDAPEDSNESSSMSHSAGLLSDNDAGLAGDWSRFYVASNTPYRDRRYLLEEFKSYLLLEERRTCVILEAGCGHGSSCFPLMDNMMSFGFVLEYIATDFCPFVLNVFRARIPPSMLPHITATCWDVTEEKTELESSCDIFLSVFCLSAVHPSDHRRTFANILKTIKPGGHLLFRDYAMHDMTMYRHATSLGPGLFQRADKTLAYYFSLEYLTELALSAGFQVCDAAIATVQVTNRKNEVSMRRCFVHAVFEKAS